MYKFIYSPAQEKLFELALPVLLAKAFEQVSPNTNSENNSFGSTLLCSTTFCPTSSRAFICTRLRKQNKKQIFSCSEQRWEHSRLFELALLTKPSKKVSEKAVRKNSSVSRRSVSRHSAPLHPCIYMHGITLVYIYIY